MAQAWDPASPAAAQLLRDGAQFLLDHMEELLDELDQAVMAAFPEQLREDVTLAAEAAASTRANIVHWATCVVRDPGAPVPANLSPEVLGIARVAIRRGEDQMLLGTYHAGQNVVWRYCMQLIFALSSDPQTLREALDLAARSIFGFIDDTVAALQAQIERERAELTGGTHAERLEVVNLILEGAPITSDKASERLRYDLRRRHTAAIVWTDAASEDTGELDSAAEALARAAGAQRPLTVIASGSSRWVWFTTRERRGPGRCPVGDRGDSPGSRGPRPAGGRDRRLPPQPPRRGRRPAPDVQRARRDARGQLRGRPARRTRRAGRRPCGRVRRPHPRGPGHGEPRATRHRPHLHPRAVQRVPCRPSPFAHRNTVTGRLQRAEQLLPTALDGNGVEIGLALELVHWLGARVSGEPARARS